MSFPGRILSSTNIFKPALHYLAQTIPQQHRSDSPSTPSGSGRRRHSDPDDIDSSPRGPALRLWHSRDSSGELDPHSGGGIPLINYSRTPSPSPYRGRGRTGRATGASGLAAQSEDDEYEEDDGEEIPVSLRPLVGGGGAAHGGYEYPAESRGWWRKLTKSENLGGFLFGTWAGWQVYVALLVVWSFGAGFLLVLMNRFILWSEYTTVSEEVNGVA